MKIYFRIILLLFMTTTSAYSQYVIPESIKDEVKIALAFYPNILNNPIEFKFQKNIKKSTMLAQPNFWSLFKAKKNRKYKVLISEKIVIAGNAFATKDIPKEVMIGWIGHELGHIIDYKNRSSLNLIWFGIKYTFSDNYIKEAERAADTHAVNYGMENYILATKNFILNNADIDESYKSRIRKYYLSPEEIMVLINERDKIEKSNDS